MPLSILFTSVPMKKSIAVKAMTALAMAGVSLIPNLSDGHTSSFGFENAGPGAVTVWAGTYHTPGETPTLEGQLLLTPQFGAMTPVSTLFTMAVGVKPAGLIDGTTNFFGDPNGGPLLSVDPIIFGTGILTWQGATVNGLVPGLYTIAYDPAFNIPSFKWTPLNATIQGGTVFTFSAAVIGGTVGAMAAAPAPVEVPEIVLIDIGAILSALDSGLPTALAQREILLNVVRTATRDFDARLFRLRSGSTFAGLPGGTPGAQGPTGHELVKRGSDGKTLHAGKDYKATAPEDFKRFELFGSGVFNTYDVDDNGPQRGFDSATYAGSVGMEYKLTRHIALGLGASYIESDTEISRSLGGTDIRGMAFSAYGSAVWRQCYFDLLYSYGVFDNEITRRTLLGSTAHGDTESRNHSIVFNTGYNFELGGLRTGPLAAVEYIHGEFDGWNERGGGRAALSFQGQQYDSLVSRIGWQASYAVPTKFGSITPQVRASWDRENLDDSEAVAVELIHSPFTIIRGARVKSGGKFSASEATRQPGQDYLNIGAGLSAQFGERASVVLDYETHLLQDGASVHVGSIRIAFAF